MKIIIIIIILAIIILQFKEVNTNNDSYDILQSVNPEKDKFEETINKKCVSVFLEVLKNLEVIKNINYKDISDMNDDNKKRLEKILSEHFQYYLIPLCLTYDFTFNIESNGLKSDLICSTSYRNLFCQIDGKKRLILFNHKQIKYLYITGKKSEIDFWNQDIDIFPKFNKAKYIEILVSPGQMIYIPYGWWYCYENLEDNIYVTCKSESFFSYFLRIP